MYHHGPRPHVPALPDALGPPPAGVRREAGGGRAPSESTSSRSATGRCCSPASSAGSPARTCRWRSAGRFGMEITAGKGFIALAAMIFGAWHPSGRSARRWCSASPTDPDAPRRSSASHVPPQLLNSIPYIVTIVVVAGVVGRVRDLPRPASPTSRARSMSAGTMSDDRDDRRADVLPRARRARGRRRSEPPSTRSR